MRRRTINVKSGGLIERALCNPTVHRQPDMAKAMRSRWMYRQDDDGTARLTPLGVLHTLTGLTLNLRQGVGGSESPRTRGTEQSPGGGSSPS